MSTIATYLGIAVGSALLLALLLRIVNDSVDETIERHVSLALGEDEAFNAWVSEALTIVQIPQQRTSIEDTSASRRS